MATVRSFRELLVWQRSMTLAEITYQITTKLPKAKLYGLVAQMRRAAVSVPSNIAEGQARNSTGEFLQFLGIAKGSLAELETQLELACQLQWVSQNDGDQVLAAIDELGRMLNGLMAKLRSSLATSH